MRASRTLFDGLVDDAAMFPPGNAGVAEAVAAHQQHRGSSYAWMIGPLVVSDQRLAELGRALRPAQAVVGQAQGVAGQAQGVAGQAQGPVAVSVVVTSGAGGLVSLARRTAEGVEVAAAECALRDLDDLAGNAARVVSAAAELDEQVSVFVEIPFAPGWERAVEHVEAAGLYGKIRTGGLAPADTPSADQLARQLSVLVEADLAFKATAGLHHAWPTPGPDPRHPRQHGFLTVLAAVEALVEGASEAEAAQVLQEADVAAQLERIVGWNDPQAARIRRRLRSFGCCGVLDPVNDLVSLELVAEPE